MIPSPLRTLFITLDQPYPPMAGAPLRNWQNMNILKQYGEVGVFSIFKGEPPIKSLPGITLWHHYNLGRKRLLKERIEQRLSRFRPWRYAYIDWLYTEVAAQELTKILNQFQPHLVIFEHLWICRYLPIVKRYNCSIIFDEHNVEADLFQQKNQSEPNIGLRLQGQIQLPYIKFWERQMCHQADQIWVCSQGDSQLLQKLYGKIIHPQVIPNGMNIRDYDEVRLKKCNLPDGLEKNDRTLIFIGSFSYPPNVEAATLLINQIYPQLKTLYPDCRLLLVGHNPPSSLQELARKEPNIICTGKVPDVKPYLAASSLVITPLLKGSGTRLKILEAFAAGLPVISTSKGAEGLNVQDGKHLLIRDEIDALVNGVSQLWSNPNLAEKLAQNAYDLVEREYSWDAVSLKIQPLLEQMFSTSKV